jgi:organic hydroperoxide reductase OsmC/OhrA
MAQQHVFEGSLRWTGRHQSEPLSATSFTRDCLIEFEGKPSIEGSAPAVFHGDDSRHNPENLLVASLMQCHFLSFMAVCVRAGVRVTGYRDRGTGVIAMKDGKMRMVEATLRPRVELADPKQTAKLDEIHQRAHSICFISNSVNFPVHLDPLAV